MGFVVLRDPSVSNDGNGLDEMFNWGQGHEKNRGMVNEPEDFSRGGEQCVIVDQQDCHKQLKDFPNS